MKIFEEIRLGTQEKVKRIHPTPALWLLAEVGVQHERKWLKPLCNRKEEQEPKSQGGHLGLMAPPSGVRRGGGSHEVSTLSTRAVLQPGDPLNVSGRVFGSWGGEWAIYTKAANVSNRLLREKPLRHFWSVRHQCRFSFLHIEFNCGFFPQGHF